MNRKITQKTLFASRSLFTSSQKQQVEFQEFKFGIEKSQLYHGYNQEELFGKKHGVHYSPMVKREMVKDTVVMWIVLALGLGLLVRSSIRDQQDQKAFNNYLLHDCDRTSKPADPIL